LVLKLIIFWLNEVGVGLWTECSTERSEAPIDIVEARRILDEDHYGKRRIVE
jgi:hypothetical protein